MKEKNNELKCCNSTCIYQYTCKRAIINSPVGSSNIGMFSPNENGRCDYYIPEVLPNKK